MVQVTQQLRQLTPPFKRVQLLPRPLPSCACEKLQTGLLDLGVTKNARSAPHAPELCSQKSDPEAAAMVPKTLVVVSCLVACFSYAR